MDRFSPNQVPTYHVEHLATFSTTTAQHEHVTPRMALQRLFKMEKTSGIWTQRMAIQLKANHMWILDGETNDVVERFPVAFIQQPTSFNDQNHIYNNILIFTVQLPNESQGELHIFQCVSHDAVNVVDDIYHWMRHYGVAIHNNNGNTISNGTNHRSTSPSNHLGNGMPDKSNNNNGNHNPHSHHHAVAASPSSNVNVKEAVNAFNQIAAQREKKGASTDSIHRLPASGNAAVDIDSRSDSSSFAETSNNHHPHHHHPVNSSTSNNNSNNNNNSSHRNHEMHETYSNERYVSILNHCFDDIERFIIRLQHAAAALRELQIRSHKRGAKGSGDGLLAIRARGPSEEEFFDILSKFKLAFNLLAKLKGCIHDPNAPELVHFLFTPLAIIIEAARGSEPPVDPSLVGIPYLSPDAIELLSNCCTSKEFDLWQSLGTTWIQPVKHIRMTSPFQPVFTDGWAPAITEPELLGIVTLADLEPDPDEMIAQTRPVQHLSPNNNKSRINHNHTFDDSDYEDQPNNNGDNSRIIAHSNHLPKTPKASVHRLTTNQSPSPVESIDRDSPTNTNGIDAEQLDWFAELQTRQAKIVRVLFPRTANNNKELTVIRGEILEVLDDSRKWWKARNSRGQVAHVPHTIVGEVESSHMIAMAGGPGDNGGGHHHPSTSMMMTNDDWIRRERQGAHDSLDYDVIINDNDRFNAEIDYRLHDPIMKQEEQWDYPYPDRDIQPLETQSLVSDTYTISQELSDLFNYGRSSSGIARMKGNQERENFLEIYSKKTEDNFSSKDLNDFLTFKEFPPYLIEFMETLFDIKEIHCKMFDWSKDELRKNVSVDVDDSMIQRLHSNLLILKNLVKPSRMNTLSLKLKHRKRDLIARYKEKNDQDELEKKAEETKAYTKDDENKDNNQMDKSEIKVEEYTSKPETENAEPITSH